MGKPDKRVRKQTEKNRKKRARAKRRQAARQQQGPKPTPKPPHKQQPAKSPEPPRKRRMLRVLGFVVSLVLGTMAVIGFLALIYGPLWPTRAIVSAGDPTYSGAFSVPFSITNSSIWFAWHDTRFDCVFEQMDLAGDNRVKGGVSSGVAVGDVSPTQTMTFDCNYPFGLKVLGATISVFVTYKILGVWETEVGAGPFVWRGDVDPPRWVEGWAATPKAE